MDKKEDIDKSIKYSNHMHLTTSHFPEDKKRVQTDSCWDFLINSQVLLNNTHKAVPMRLVLPRDTGSSLFHCPLCGV